jgi:hypothetical protein
MIEKKRRGLTLAELIISMVVLIILGGIIFLMVIRSKVYFQSSAARSASRQEIQVAMMKMSRELRGSNRDLVTTGTPTGLQAFSFVSAEDRNGMFVTDSYGFVQWQKYVIYYIPAGTRNLLRKEIYRDFSTTAAAPLSASALMSYLDGKGFGISASAKSISLTMLDEPNAVKLRLDTEQTNTHGKIDRQSAEITVVINNNKAR